MVKNGKKSEGEKKAVKRILITQPRPESIKSPYFELAAKHSVEMEFMPFIQLEAIPSKDFRKQKIDISGYSAVILFVRK
jgi:uroporphyrinogen-III synthase